MVIEIPLPDAECRRRLLALYGQGMNLRLKHPERLITRTEGVSAAFIRELLRKAALFAAEHQPTRTPLIKDAHIDEAMQELLFAGGNLTRKLLGAGIDAGQSTGSAGSD